MEHGIKCFTKRNKGRSPKLAWRGLCYGARKMWALRSGIIRGRRPHRISFFIHNFMDAEKLQRERCEACVFMVATANGPLSMCVHNAKRDAMITQAVPQLKGQTAWNPLENKNTIKAEELPIKKLKGTLRAARNKKKLARAK